MRHVSRPHRVALHWLFDRINWDPKIQIKNVDTNNQLADMLTKSSFKRDEWDHLLHLLNIMNFLMFSCSHFLSNRKQSAMSKRAQESTAKEGSAVAKPRPMNVVSRNLLSAKQTSPKDSSASKSPGNQELEQSYVSPSVRKLMRNKSRDPTAYSQERRQDDTLFSSTRKLERGDDIKIGRTKLEFHNMRVSDHRYLERVFQNLRQKLNLAEEAPVLGVEALKTNVLICGLLLSTTMKAAVHLGPKQAAPQGVTN